MSVTVATSAPTRSLGDAMAARLRNTAIVVVASGVAGATVGGIGSRVMMRLAALAAPEARGAVTENGNIVGEITLGGTVGLLLIAGTLSAIFGAAAYVMARPWLPRRTIARGLVFGVALLALFGASLVDPGNADFVILGDRGLNIAMLSALFVAFGLVVSGAVAILETRVPPAATFSLRRWAVTALCALPVLPGLAGIAFVFLPRFGVVLLAAWVAMGTATVIHGRGHRGQAQLIRLGATVGMLVIVGRAGSDYVDAVTTLL